MNSHKEIMAKWPSLDEFAADLGIKFLTAKQMRYRDSIGSHHWRDLVAAAERRGFDGVTLEALAEIDRARRREPAA
jgi:hypothetical protein